MTGENDSNNIVPWRKEILPVHARTLELTLDAKTSGLEDQLMRLCHTRNLNTVINRAFSTLLMMREYGQAGWRMSLEKDGVQEAFDPLSIAREDTAEWLDDIPSGAPTRYKLTMPANGIAQLKKLLDLNSFETPSEAYRHALRLAVFVHQRAIEGWSVVMERGTEHVTIDMLLSANDRSL